MGNAAGASAGPPHGPYAPPGWGNPADGSRWSVGGAGVGALATRAHDAGPDVYALPPVPGRNPLCRDLCIDLYVGLGAVSSQPSLGCTASLCTDAPPGDCVAPNDRCVGRRDP